MILDAEGNALVVDGHFNFALVWYFLQSKFYLQRRLIGRLEEFVSQGSMYFHRSPEDGIGLCIPHAGGTIKSLHR